MTTNQQAIAKRQLLQLAASVADSVTAVAVAIQASTVNNAQPLERKPLSPELKTLLAKAGLTAQAERGVLSVAEVDKSLEASGVKGRDAMTAKFKLMQAGLLTVGGK